MHVVDDKAAGRDRAGTTSGAFGYRARGDLLVMRAVARGLGTPPTLRSIADHCGLNINTARRALNGGTISRDTIGKLFRAFGEPGEDWAALVVPVLPDPTSNGLAH